MLAGNGSVVDGDYELPVPKGGSYKVALQALDGEPVAASRVSTTAIVGDLLGQLQFPEEFYNRGTESDSEARPDRVKTVSAPATGIDLITDRQTVVRNHDGQREFIGTGAIFGAQQITYGETFSADLLLPALRANRALVAGRALTDTLDPAQPVVFTSAALHLGRSDGQGGFDVTRTLKTFEGPFGQDEDYAPVFFNGTKGLSQKIEQALRKDPTLEVLFTISVDDTSNIGPSGFPANFVSLDASPSNTVTSYLGLDGGPLMANRADRTWLMELRLAP